MIDKHCTIEIDHLLADHISWHLAQRLPDGLDIKSAEIDVTQIKICTQPRNNHSELVGNILMAVIFLALLGVIGYLLQ